MPPCRGRLAQTSLRSVQDVSTSDHKPVVATFRVQASPRMERTGDAQTTINCTGLSVRDILSADFNGTSDPFCRFYVHPDGLMKSVKTSVKWRVKPGDSAGRTGDAAAGLPSLLLRTATRLTSVLRKAQPSLVQWRDTQVPPLHLHVPFKQLSGASLLIAAYDYDYWKPNDPLGVVTIPLGPPDGGAERSPDERSPDERSPDERSPDERPTTIADAAKGLLRQSVLRQSVLSEPTSMPKASATPYQIAVDMPLVHGHATAGTGRLTCTLHVSPRQGTEGRGLISRLLLALQRRRHRHAAQLESEGAYVGAAKELETASSASDAHSVDIGDSEAVRSWVTDLTRLAEMRWRYRVVEKGESPSTAAITMLESARAMIDQHRAHLMWLATKTHSSDPAAGSGRRPSDTSRGHAAGVAPDGGADAAAFRLEWACERSAVLHGLCATRLIFHDGAPTALVEAQLGEAIALRREKGLHAELADSLNALGTLKQKQRAFAQAEQHYTTSLELRRGRGGATVSEAAREQAIAQSLVSLGNLATERADALGGAMAATTEGSAEGGAPAEGGAAAVAEGGATAEGGAEGKDASALYAEARDYLEGAARCYVNAGGALHPKVAWAYEGLGRLHEKMGELDAALAAFERAAEIRRALQSQDESKEMFSKELDHVEKQLARLSSCRQQASSVEVIGSDARGSALSVAASCEAVGPLTEPASRCEDGAARAMASVDDVNLTNARRGVALEPPSSGLESVPVAASAGLTLIRIPPTESGAALDDDGCADDLSTTARRLSATI